MLEHLRNPEPTRIKAILRDTRRMVQLAPAFDRFGPLLSAIGKAKIKREMSNIAGGFTSRDGSPQFELLRSVIEEALQPPEGPSGPMTGSAIPTTSQPTTGPGNAPGQTPLGPSPQQG